MRVSLFVTDSGLSQSLGVTVMSLSVSYKRVKCRVPNRRSESTRFDANSFGRSPFTAPSDCKISKVDKKSVPTYVKIGPLSRLMTGGIYIGIVEG